MPSRRRIEIQGTVQGIGFRPFVYRIAQDAGLTGFVQNDGVGVVVEIQGSEKAVNDFVEQLEVDLPPGGRIDRLHTESMPIRAADDPFVIAPSAQPTHLLPNIAPDRNVCAACLAEMRDPSDRRFGYPFINCTHCGPRYTIVDQLPYDRPNTSMARFELCADCRAEYTDPLNRRFHAEPVACPVCGPQIRLELQNGSAVEPDAFRAAACLLREGRIVAVKGIGGFHLAVNAEDNAAVERLRQVKQRPRKPFAIMVKDASLAAQIAHLDDRAASLMRSPQAPIVLAPVRNGVRFIDWIAPGLRDIGILLPYTPLHHLLFETAPPILVMTSGNPAAEPITIRNEETVKLGADAVLLHDRDIVVAADDSVVRTAPNGPIIIRRARGFVPEPIDAAHLPGRSVLGLGALLKVTVSALHLGRLSVGCHLGDLDNERTEKAFEKEVERMLSFLRFDPERIALDLHPDLPSADLARSRFQGIDIFRVQHHHAHLAAVMAEHGMTPEQTVVGIVMDGFGFGMDGTLWGGELLTGGYARFKRRAHLRGIPQPGGDRAAQEPGRMAISLLLDGEHSSAEFPELDARLETVAEISSVSPLTSSAGRLFDGAAALLGIAHAHQSYEGEAAARLEAVADPAEASAYFLPLHDEDLDTRVLISAMLDDAAPTPVRAARFINGLADGFVRAACETGISDAVLAGGCMVNRLLVARLISGLERAGLRVFLPRRLPPGDGAISAGQAAVAACAAQSVARSSRTEHNHE